MPSPFGQYWQGMRSWWDGMTEAQRDVAKIVAGLLVLGAIIVGGWYVGLPYFHRWQQGRALTEAREFAGRKDYRNALVAFHRVIEKNPTDVQSWKQVADFLSEIGSPEVLVARRNLVWLAPDDISLRLGFVLDALRFGDVEGAREVAGGVREGAREEVDFFRMAAALAYASGRTDEFEANLGELLRRQPGDDEASLDLATLRLWGADAAQAATARTAMVELLAKRTVRVRAAVELLKHVARTGGRREAAVLVARLHEVFVGRPAPSLAEMPADQLTEPPGWAAVVDALKRDAASAANDAAVLGRWLATVGQPRETLTWLESLPIRVRRSPLVGAAELELSLRLDDADRLRRLLVNGAWGRAGADVVDLAFAARWQRRLGKVENARATWADAIAAAGESLSGLRVLSRLAVAWSDEEGAQAAMLAVVQRYPTERWAWEALRIEYSRKQDTAKLRSLYDKWVLSPMNNRFIEQDWVILNFLVGSPAQSAFARAKALRDAAPFDPVAELGYALALRAQGRMRDAYVAIDGLVGADRETPRARLWRGIMLGELGRKAEARGILSSVPIEQLMPEEVRLGREAYAQSAPAKQLPSTVNSRLAEPAKSSP